MDDRRVRPLLLLVFAASGLAGLICEAVWSQYLKLFLGHAAHAQTLVLTIFLGGLALGSWLSSRWLQRLADPLRGYALAEGLLGVAAFLFHPLFIAATSFAYATALPALPSAGASTAFRWALATALILPQSVLLGTTFPLMAAGLLRRRPESHGSSLSLLYFANSIGGAVGVLATSFLIVRAFGLPGALAVAGTVNLAAAATALALAGGSAMVPPGETAPPPAARPHDAAFRLMLGAAAVTGAASFVYEVVWIRLLTLVLGTSTHSFEVMLSAFILGLALGSLWIRRRIDRSDNRLRLLAVVQVLMGVLALATLPLYGQAFRLIERLLAVLPKTDAGYALFLASSHGIALTVMLPATFCAGMTLPLITAALLGSGHGERSVGAVYAANTLGGIAGVLFAVHVAVPQFGLRGAITLGAALDTGLGILLAWASVPGSTLRWRLSFTTAAIVSLPLLFTLGRLDDYLLASGVYRVGTLPDRQRDRILARRDGKTSTVHIVRQGGVLSLRTNGKGDAGIGIGPEAPVTADESTTVLLAALPLLMRPDAAHAANIGVGSGLTSHELLASPGISSLDTIEIEPAVADLARHFLPRNARLFDDPRSRIHIEDARAFFAGSRQRYDIVVSEPSAVWVSGNASLFTVEFYRQARERLTARGLFVQWLHLYEIGPDQVYSVLKAFNTVFPDWVVYLPNDFDAIIVGSASGELPPPVWTHATTAPFAEALARIGVHGPRDLRLRRVADRRSLGPYLLRTVPPENSDYRPYVDQRAGRARFLQRTVTELRELDHPVPVVRLLGSAPPGDDSSLPGSSHDLDLARQGHAAAVFLDVIRSTPPGAPPEQFADEPPEIVERVTRLVARCAAPANDALGAAYQVAVEIAPFLSPTEAAALWETLERWPCVQGLSPEERPWIPFFRAVGALDTRAMAEEGTRLARTGAAGRLRRFALAGALLGRVARGEKEAALNLWREQIAADLSPSQRTLFAVVLAHAGALP